MRSSDCLPCRKRTPVIIKCLEVILETCRSNAGSFWPVPTPCVRVGLSPPGALRPARSAQPLGRPIPLSWPFSADHHGAAAEGHLSGSAQLPGPDHRALQPRECAGTHHGSSGQPLLPQGAGQQAGRGGVSWGPVLSLSRLLGLGGFLGTHCLSAGPVPTRFPSRRACGLAELRFSAHVAALPAPHPTCT